MEQLKLGMESIVICPCCNEQVYVVMNPEQESVTGFIKMIESSMGIGKTEHFDGENKCKCGKVVKAALHVSARG